MAVARLDDFRDEDDETFGADEASVADRADDDGFFATEDDGQMFLLERDKKVTLGSLIRRGTPVEYVFKLTAKGVKGKGDMGLISFSEPDITLLVTGRAGKVEVDPTYDDSGQVTKVTVRASVKPQMVYDARSAAARELLPAVED